MNEKLGKVEKTLIVADFHVPFHDKRLFELLLKFAAYYKPKKIFLPGDLIDCYTVSSFSKDPVRAGSLQKELDVARVMLGELHKVCKDITFIEGNHEYRVVTHLRKNPQLYGLDCLSTESLLRLESRGIKSYSYMHAPIRHHGFLITHGHVVRKYSGWTAKAMYEKYGGSGVCGHSHRGGNFIKRNMFGVFAWYENMCMCDLEPEYLDFADWQQGWCVAHFTEGGRFHVDQIPVVKYKFIYDNRMFRV